MANILLIIIFLLKLIYTKCYEFNQNNNQTCFSNIKLCNESYFSEFNKHSKLNTNLCMVPMKQNFSNEFLGSLNFAQSKQNQIRSKRGVLGIASKLGKASSKLGILDGLGGEGAGTDGGDYQSESQLKEKLEVDKEKIEDIFESHKDEDTLKESLDNIEITNDVSFDGFDEFKMSDTRIEFNANEGEEGIGTLESITFRDGVGLYIALECYRESDPLKCSKLLDKAKNTKQKSCGKHMIPSAFTIGTGFLISQDTVDKTRRKSLITRLCNKPIRYGDKYIPDGMSIAEIYDSEAHSAFFSDVGQYVNYLSSTYGVSITTEELNSVATKIGGGLPMFASFQRKKEEADRKKDANSSDRNSNNEAKAKKQILLSLFEINVIRYSLFIENMRPEYINPFFLIDFMTLPENYFLGDAYQKYEKFLFRYGTHYIHSAEFGGQILFENSRVDVRDSSINDMAEDSWKEIQSAFGNSETNGADGSVPTSFVSVDLGGRINNIKTNNKANGLRNNDYINLNQAFQRNWTNLFLQSQGGQINIAKLITRFEGNTGPTLTEWLRSIPKHPKAFKSKMRPINELLNFNIRVLFNYQATNVTCKRSPTVKCIHGTNIEEFQAQFDNRRKSLEFAIEIFRHKSASIFSDLLIEAGTPETCLFSVNSQSSLFPSYEEILNGTDIKIVTNLDADYKPFVRGEEIYVIYNDGVWFSKKRHQNYNFLRTFKTPKIDRLAGKNLIVIKNLVFEYNESTGDLTFLEIGQNLQSHSSLVNHQEIISDKASLNINWGANGLLRNTKIAKVSYVNILQGIAKASSDRFFVKPCNLDWSTANSRRFTVTLEHGKCLKFIASSYGDIFVVFVTNPHNEYTWYFLQISSYGVALFKAGRVVKYNLNSNAGSLKDKDLFRRFFICMNYEMHTKAKPVQVKRQVPDEQSFYFRNEQKIEQTGLFIQYGIIDGYDSNEIVYLSYFDTEPLELRYYMFGSYDSKVFVYDINVHELNANEEAQLRCSGSNLTLHDHKRCQLLCHNNCLGCSKANSTVSCIKCRFAEYYESGRLTCLDSCPKGFEKDSTFSKCQDIDECNRNETTLIYKNGLQDQVYSWNKCPISDSKCINEIGGFTCECLPGYTGHGYNCTDINECDSLVSELDCTHNSECINLPGSYKCECRKGFKFEDRKCIDIDECFLGIDECQVNSHCVNKLGSYQCKCNEGFTGNGIYCQDIDECEVKVANCMMNSDCINTSGSYRCECKKGYKLDNNVCIEHTDSINLIIKEYLKTIEEKNKSRKGIRKTKEMCLNENKKLMPELTYCKFQNNCDKRALCIYNVLGRSYTCECSSGFIGNGFKCYDERIYFARDNKICKHLSNGQTICS